MEAAKDDSFGTTASNPSLFVPPTVGVCEPHSVLRGPMKTVFLGWKQPFLDTRGQEKSWWKGSKESRSKQHFPGAERWAVEDTFSGQGMGQENVNWELSRLAYLKAKGKGAEVRGGLITCEREGLSMEEVALRSWNGMGSSVQVEGLDEKNRVAHLVSGMRWERRKGRGWGRMAELMEENSGNCGTDSVDLMIK